MLTIQEKIRITGVIGDLSIRWEELNDAGKKEEAAEVLDHYQNLVLFLMSTGWRDYLPTDTELEDKYMPAAYLEMIKNIVL